MPATLAPIAFFAFNRPEHTERTLRALAANPEASNTILYAFVDGPRNSDESATVTKVLDIISKVRGFAALHVHDAQSNLGLFNSITRGVQTVLDTSETIIVVEDDIQVAPCFLAYMNDALQKYHCTPEVGSVHAYAPPIKNLPDYYFLRGADCWGWATWADRWRLFERNPGTLLQMLSTQKLLRAFTESHGAQSLLQLVRRAQGRSQSWAIQWHASLFLENRYTLHPGHPFAANIGNDGSGTHSASTTIHDNPLIQRYDRRLPLQVREDRQAAGTFSRVMDRQAMHNLPIPHWMLREYAVAAARREVFR